MKLWQKTFLLSSLLCTAVLYVCVFCITAPSIRAIVRATRDAGIREERVIAEALGSTVALVGESRRDSAIGAFLAYYAKTGLLFKVAQDGRVIYDTLEADAPAEPGHTGFARIGETMLLYVTDRLPTGYTLVFAKPVAAETALVGRQAWTAVLAGAGVALALCVSLYVLMRRINQPVSRLAHELRTPLTVMRGYAETLQSARLSEEQRYQATSYIIAESRRLADVSEKLLAMHDLGEDAAGFVPVDVGELFLRVQQTYPHTVCRVERHTILGDPALLQSLVNNLLQNARRASAPDAPIELYAGGRRITVTDHGRGMTRAELSYANRPSRLAPP